MKPVIHMDNVSFRYKEAQQNSISQIELTIRHGECVLLCGASGCGKTTVTRLINGLILHYYEGELSGEVTVMGKSVANTPIEVLSESVGSVFQNPRSQFFCVDTDGEIAFGCENLGLPEAEIRDRVNNTVQEMQLSPLMGRSIFDLSGGEKQKIACAGVACMQPDIIVLDEPTSNLDLDEIEGLRRTLLHWKQQGKIIVIAEHRLGWLNGLCERVVVLDSGRIADEYNGEAFFRLSADALNGVGLRAIHGTTNYLCGSLGFYPRIPIDHTTEQMILDNIKCRYGQRTVLQIAHLEIPIGSVTAVVGHNGAGKTTFVKALCGLQKHCKGMVTIAGEHCNLKQMQRFSYMVMQDVNHQLFAESVLEEVMLGMREADEAKALEILQKLDLAVYKDRHPLSLSGGQKQRTAIASALLAGKKLLVFDEPTSGLDYRHMADMAKLLQSLSKDITVLIVTHDMELIERCCTHVLHIENGRIEEKHS